MNLKIDIIDSNIIFSFPFFEHLYKILISLYMYIYLYEVFYIKAFYFNVNAFYGLYKYHILFRKTQYVAQ